MSSTRTYKEGTYKNASVGTSDFEKVSPSQLGLSPGLRGIVKTRPTPDRKGLELVIDATKSIDLGLRSSQATAVNFKTNPAQLTIDLETDDAGSEGHTSLMFNNTEPPASIRTNGLESYLDGRVRMNENDLEMRILVNNDPKLKSDDSRIPTISIFSDDLWAAEPGTAVSHYSHGNEFEVRLEGDIMPKLLIHTDHIDKDLSLRWPIEEKPLRAEMSVVVPRSLLESDDCQEGWDLKLPAMGPDSIYQRDNPSHVTAQYTILTEADNSAPLEPREESQVGQENILLMSSRFRNFKHLKNLHDTNVRLSRLASARLNSPSTSKDMPSVNANPDQA